MEVSDILARKRQALVTIGPDETVAALSRLLRERRIGAAVVSRDQRSIDGVVSERDVAYKLSQFGADFGQMPVSVVMTRDVITCHANEPVGTIASRMLSSNIRHLPVVDDAGALIGMVSMRDVLSIRIEQLQRETALLRGSVKESSRQVQDRE